MSYKYFVTKRAPISAWILDDTVPFQEYTGFNASGGKKSGSADPEKSASLVAGSAWSSVFKSSALGQFSCPLFKQGLENRPFALETWIYPIQKTVGLAAQTYRENLVPNPSAAVDTSNWGANAGVTLTRDTTTVTLNGSASFKSTPTSASAAIYMVASTSPVVTAGTVVTMSAYVKGTSGDTARIFDRRSDVNSPYNWVSENNFGTNITLNGTWQRVSVTFTQPVDARLGIMLRSSHATNVWYADAVMMERSASLGTFFDGTFAGFQWQGTANASVSYSMVNISKINLAVTTVPTSGNTSEGSVWRIGASYWGGEKTISFPSTGDGPLGLGYARDTITATTHNSNGRWTIGTNPDGTTPGVPVLQGEVYTISFYQRMSLNVTTVGLSIKFRDEAGTQISISTPSVSGIVQNQWNYTSYTVTVPAGATRLQAYTDLNVTAIGATFDVTGLCVVRGSSASPFFDGNSIGAAWSGSANTSWSYMKVSSSPQQILSHDGVFDGLTIEGKVIKFSTQYLTTGSAQCDYDLQDFKRAHIVATHSPDQNQLWINGELVDSVDITDEQKSDTYIAAATSDLFSGYSVSSQEVAMNGVAFYSSLSGEQIKQNYQAGINVVPQARIHPQYDGISFPLNYGYGTIFLDESWVSVTDFNNGLKNSVEYDSTKIMPSYVSGISVPGTWTAAVPLDAQGDTSIYGVSVSWSGNGVVVDASLDGTSWTTAVNGELLTIITNGYNPTNKDLQIRVSFAGGLSSDPAYLESLHVVGFRNNNFSNSQIRTITATYPAVLRNDYEPIHYRDDNGVYLDGGTLTIGADTSADPTPARTLELWIKPVSGTPTISVGATKYRNGVLDSTLPIGQWSLIHYVEASDISGSITISGDCIVGQATLYPTSLSATDADFIYDSYTGFPVVRFSDTNAIAVAETSPASNVYTHDWSISGAG